MKKGFLPLILILLFSGACGLFQSKPKPTQLEIREFQTRTFETKNVKMVMKAMLNVLQDEGYIVKNADSDLGFLTATKETDLGGGNFVFWPKSSKDEPSKWNKTSVIETTANVSEFGNSCKVRVNFVRKILDNTGAIVEVDQITDGKYYQDFFSKVDKSIFLQKEKL